MLQDITEEVIRIHVWIWYKYDRIWYTYDMNWPLRWYPGTQKKAGVYVHIWGSLALLYSLLRELLGQQQQLVKIQSLSCCMPSLVSIEQLLHRCTTWHTISITAGTCYTYVDADNNFILLYDFNLGVSEALYQNNILVFSSGYRY